ncbi:hypothetical protein CJA_2906 [Cellvibrio japonicus Ueda107]|uniref:Uncharacterized protein n=1 Tax=Cellvibrio japonicus (strain Ueda107) TaxID=498211 RepID=B3PCJ7_CELJU|nr:hypothetical protein CJA_2906 [Cellvibrio japonicus Ueda107]
MRCDGRISQLVDFVTLSMTHHLKDEAILLFNGNAG